MNSNNLIKISLVTLIFILGAAVLFLLFTDVTVKIEFKNIYHAKELEFAKEASVIKDEAKKIMQARYGVNEKFLEEVAKKVDIEKKKLAEIEGRLNKKIK